MKVSRLFAVCTIAASLVLGLRSQAQAVYGSIYGTVTDTSGAVIPNATVTITDVAKGTSVSVKSNESGEYTAEHLIPDAYDVKVEMQGFQTFVANGVQVAADTSPKVDVQLKAGATSTTVTVSADTIPELKTDRADVATEFTTKDVEDLPIPDRNFTNLQTLLPGAQPLPWSHAADENPQASKQIQVDGQAFGGVAFQLDGTDNQDPILGIIVINPPLDAVSETKITTQNFDAEFGKAVSSFISAQTKSGSNNFHGSAFDYRESSANLATDPYTQFRSPGSTGPLIAPGLKNQFGGSVGGPILKDRLFFFGDYQGVRQKVGTSATASVPTAHLVSTCLGQSVASNGIAGCDFSEYALGILGSSSDQLIYQQTAGGSTPYPGNVIPAAQLSPQTMALFTLLAKYPPNSGGTVAAGSLNGLKNNYSASGTGLFNNNQWDVRVDDQVKSGMHAFTRFSRFTDVLSGTTMFGEAGGPGFGIGGYGGTSKGADDSLAAGMDIAVSPQLLTDFRLGYYRYGVVDSKYDGTTAFGTQLGIPGVNIVGNSFTDGAPGFNLADADRSGNQTANNAQGTGPQYGSGLNITRCNCPLTEKEDQFQIVNNWTRLMGNHAIKLGVDLRYARNLRVPSDTDRAGLFTFNPGPTSNGGSSGGLGMASFVLGDVSNFGRYVSTSITAKEFQKRDFFYAQDTWHPKPSLTINYGIRYEMYFPESVGGKQSPGMPEGKGQGALMQLNDGAGGYKTDGYLKVAGYGGIPTNLGWGMVTNAWNPRLGVAWSVDQKTVIRAGYGRSFDLGVFGSIFGHVVTQNLPVLANQSVSAASTAATAFTLAQGPPAFVFPSVPDSGLLPAPGYNVSVKARPNTMRLPTLDAWNMSVERAITPTMSLTVAYVGNKGTHTLSAGDGNNTNPNEAGIFLPSQYSVTGSTLHYDPSVPGGQIAADGGTSTSNFLSRFYGGGLQACTDPNYQAQLAAQNEPMITPGMCGWTQGISYYGDDQDTNYNALQVSLAKQYTHGLSYNIQYAWQRSFNFNNGYATWNKSVTYGPDDWIRPEQLVIYGTYQLPFGKNQMFASNASRLEDAIIGGWQLAPVLNWSDGLPFSLNLAGGCGASLPGSAPCYPVGRRSSLHTSLSGFNAISHTRTFFKAPAAGTFTQASLDTFGNVGRNSFLGPGFFNTDLSLQKNVPIHESITGQFRMDAYNVFNHINPGNPGGDTAHDGNITGEPGLGVYTSPRQLQFSLRVDF